MFGAGPIGLLRSGRIPAEQFITGRIAVDDILESGFRELIHNKEENIKILVHP
ncbi:hypothetical protein [Sinomonas flava]|uniref:hypothetical protein n=1 Tax=Sinomonas flava TaxID=496857 RepID=UPI0039A4D786